MFAGTNFPSADFASLFALDLETGTVSSAYESIFSHMNVQWNSVSPDGKTAMFSASPKQRNEKVGLVIMHNLLGATGDN